MGIAYLTNLKQYLQILYIINSLKTYIQLYLNVSERNMSLWEIMKL